ncbi:MAG: hypothetical protein QNJ37_13045 [Crocosphaera sp.]|nr:hypothetical protein [Crocosphaera sp.]
MPKRIEIAPHLSVTELQAKYRAAKNSVTRSQYQIIWLLASGKKTAISSDRHRIYGGMGERISQTL